jgi:hypothetical protein
MGPSMMRMPQIATHHWHCVDSAMARASERAKYLLSPRYQRARKPVRFAQNFGEMPTVSLTMQLTWSKVTSSRPLVPPRAHIGNETLNPKHLHRQGRWCLPHRKR